MENQQTEDNHNFDDEPCPPPGLSRLVTGQTFSFDEGLNSPPFDRVVPGDSEPYQMFPPASKKNNFGNFFANENPANNSSPDFFDSYLENSSTPNNDFSSNPNKNKYANKYFNSPDTEERETFFHPDVSRLPPNAYDSGNSKNTSIPFDNFKNRTVNQHPVTKPTSKVSESMLYDNGLQSLLAVSKPEKVPKFEHNVFPVQHENDPVTDNREKQVVHFQQNSFPPNPEKDKRNDPSSDRMAVEGSCDNVYPKTVSSSTPLQYDYWYKNNTSNTFGEHQEVQNPSADDVKMMKRDSNIAYGGKYVAERLPNTQNAPLVSSNMHFTQPNVLQAPQDCVNAHSKTPSISSNTSSINESSGYQHENYISEQKRIDHFSNNEISDNSNSLSNYDVTAIVANKQKNERLPKNYETHQSENDFVNDPRQLQKLDINREINNDEDREISHYVDSDERPIGKRTVLGYNHNTIPRTQKNVEKPVQDVRTGKQFSYDTSHIKGNKLKPPLEQRLVVGETSSEAVVQNISRSRDGRLYNDEKTKRPGKESVSGRNERSRKKTSYESRQDRRKIESDDDSIDPSYDDGPDHDSHSYHDPYYRNSPRRFDKRLPRRHPESSFAQSQDESFYDEEDEDDDYVSFINQRKYRRPPREQSYRSFYNDTYREERKYRRPHRDYYGGFEDESFFEGRNSRPSSRTGSELFRPLPHSNQRYYPRIPGYEYLDHREVIRYTAEPRMKKDEIIYWSAIRETDPQMYMNWFKNKFPKSYAQWYSHYVNNKVVSTDSYQADHRCGSGHSGQSSVNNDTLSMNEEKLHGVMFRPESEANSIIQETICSPLKFSLPHVKGVFSSLGQLIEVNACSPQDGQIAKIDIKKLGDPNEPDWIEFLNFTGPFIPGETHVHTVSQFLKYHAETSDNSSKKLLYLLIDLIIKLRGVADGITISELLTASFAESQKPNSLLKKEDDLKQSNDFQSIDEVKVIERYTNLLLQGDKHSALELAVNHKLWGHAFLLSSKMGTKYYINVLAKFDSSISANDPLKTLYQLHSNQIPFSATACSDEKWGDWRPHLAMILSNPTSGNELDKTSIITLGDSLAPKDIYAAHFCYLAAGLDFEPPNKPSSKLTLLSLRNNVDHFGVTTPNHAILLTQTYEFAKRLQRKDYTISALLPFKYLLAIRLLDYNRSSIALQYLESIALDLMKTPYNESYDLMYNVLEISERIKYSDSKPLVSDSGDKQWLTDLRQIVDEIANRPLDQNSCQKPWQPDQSLHSSNLQQTPLTQPLPPQILQPSQPSPLYTPSDELKQPVLFQPTFINQPPSSLPTPQPNSSWDNPPFSHDSLDVVSSGFSQLPPNNSVDVNDNISTQPSNNFNQPSNDNYQQQNVYNPWDQPHDPIISIHSRHNYFNDNTTPRTQEDNTQNRTPENQTPTPSNTQNEDKNVDKKTENNGGLFGRLINTFKRSNIHEAKLPDDKDPSLIYDKNIGAWIDKDKKDDGNGGDFKPPPTTSEFNNIHKVDNESSYKNNATFYNQNKPTAPLTSSRSGNGYSLSGKKGMKSNYVNVLANSQLNARPPNMPTPPSFPSSQVPNMNLFVPPGQNNSAS